MVPDNNDYRDSLKVNVATLVELFGKEGEVTELLNVNVEKLKIPV